MAASLTILASAGLQGALGTEVLMVSLAGWTFLVARLADNEARHVAATAAGRPLPAKKLRRLLFPWWGRAALLLGVLAATQLAVGVFDGNGPVAVTYALGLAGAWLVERAVIAARSRD